MVLAKWNKSGKDGLSECQFVHQKEVKVNLLSEFRG